MSIEFGVCKYPSDSTVKVLSNLNYPTILVVRQVLRLRDLAKKVTGSRKYSSLTRNKLTRSRKYPSLTRNKVPGFQTETYSTDILDALMGDREGQGISSKTSLSNENPWIFGVLVGAGCSCREALPPAML